MPRYVILEHDHPRLHWDLLLESGQMLRTWRLAEPPRPGRVVQAEASFDHRPCYLDYEGPISRGRGRVVRWDAGVFSWEVDEPACISVRLDGRRGRALAHLRLQGDGTWLLTLEEAHQPNLDLSP